MTKGAGAADPRQGARVDPAARPNFFLLGAPKCGTTAMSEYLRGHPEICFSRPKETYQFCADLPGFHRERRVPEFLSECFGHCAPGARAIGEGSVFNLLSEVAVDRILALNPDSRFIAMVRDPVEVARAFHAQMLYNASEDVRDFETAWCLQPERAAGGELPDTCREPKLLQYRRVAALGSQLERLLARVPRDRVEIIVFDDFITDTRAAYERVIRFLGLEPDGRTEFPRINPRKRHRVWRLAPWIQRPPRFLVRAAKGVKRFFGFEGRLGIVPTLRSLNTRPEGREPLRPDFRAELVEEFEPEIRKIERMLDRDLTAWRAVPG